MAKNKVIFTIFLAFLLSFTLLCGCAEKGADSDLDQRGNDGVNSLNQTSGDETPGELPAITPGQSSEDDTTVRTPEEKPPVTQWEEKVYWTGSIEDHFDGSTVLVVLDKNIGGPNKVHDKSFFGGIEIESIEDLTYFTIEADKINELGINWGIWRQLLKINLPGNSKENVVNAIRQLEKIDGIRSAEPDGPPQGPDFIIEEVAE